MMRNNFIVNYICLLLAQLSVGVTIVGSKFLIENMQPTVILLIRFSIGFILLLVAHLLFGKQKIRILSTLTFKDWLYISAQALCAGALFNIFLLVGLNYTNASLAGIITSALPAIVAIFAIIFLKEKLTFFTGSCILLTLIGLVIINVSNFNINELRQLLGSGLILLALLPEAVYYMLAKIHKNKLPVFLLSALMNVINIPVFFIIVFFQHYTFSIDFSGMQLLLLLLVGLSSASFYVFWFLGCKQVSGVAAGLSTAFMPIATVILAWLFLRETTTMLQMIGMMLVISSILLNASRYLKR